MAITKELVYIGDFLDKAKKLKLTWGVTDLYSTGHKVLDNYFSGGYGRRSGYEIVLLFGPTGVGKSTVALNLMADAIRRGTKIGLLVLEDDMADVSVRLEKILGAGDYQKMNAGEGVVCLPEDALEKSWKLTELLEYIEDWFTVQKVDLILLDHLQFAFENAESIKGENEWAAQRVFMQGLNQLMKRTGKTIILVSHVNKAPAAKGMDKIVGSGSLAQAATKVIEVTEDPDLDNTIRIQIRKSRFTPRPPSFYCMLMIDGSLEPVT